MATKVGRRSVIASIPAFGAAVAARPAARASNPARVRFAYFGDESELKAYEVIVDLFEREHPSISIDRVPIASYNVPPRGMSLPSGGYPEWLRNSFTAGEPPDVYMLGYRDVGRYAAGGKMEPLGSYLRSSSVFAERDFYPAALDAFRSPYLGDDEIGAIPQNVSSLVVYYNVDMFDELGLDRPDAGWSWDQFAAAALALTRDLDGDGRIDVHGLALEPSIMRFAPVIWSAGGEVVDDVLRPTKLLIDTPEAKAGIQWLASLGVAGFNVTPASAAARQLDDTRRFARGRAAMLIQSRRVTTFLRQNSIATWDVAPLPVGKQAANLLHSDGLAMFAGSHSKEAAWTFIEYVMGPTGQTLLAESGRTVPSLQAIAESESFLKGTSLSQSLGLSFKPKNARVFLDNIALSRRLPSEAGWSSVVRGLDIELKRAFYEDVDVEETVQRILNWTDFAFENMSTLRRRLFELQVGGPESED